MYIHIIPHGISDFKYFCFQYKDKEVGSEFQYKAIENGNYTLTLGRRGKCLIGISSSKSILVTEISGMYIHIMETKTLDSPKHKSYIFVRYTLAVRFVTQFRTDVSGKTVNSHARQHCHNLNEQLQETHVPIHLASLQLYRKTKSTY